MCELLLQEGVEAYKKEADKFICSGWSPNKSCDRSNGSRASCKRNLYPRDGAERGRDYANPLGGRPNLAGVCAGEGLILRNEANKSFVMNKTIFAWLRL
jgi:hypothetical protein